MTIVSRICKSCEEEKSLSKFPSCYYKGEKKYYEFNCKKCKYETVKEKLEDEEFLQIHKDRRKANRKRIYTYNKKKNEHLKHYYGITLDMFLDMLEDQNHTCPGCGGELVPYGNGDRNAVHVDHCHDTGQVRGLLCGHCNIAIGQARDSVATLRALADYLEGGE